MHNVFETLKYDSNLTIDDYNQVIKEVFFKYFKDELTFIKNKELLRTELVNYIKYIAKNEKFEKLFENILKVFNDAILKDKNKVIQELATNLLTITKTDSLYLAYYIRQPKDISSYSQRELSEYYFDVIGYTLESCYKPRIELFYKIYKFNQNGIFENLTSKTFGDILNSINNFDELTKDAIFNIVFSQWRNIADHKDFDITKDNIQVRYGKGNNRKSKSLSHTQLKEIAFSINQVYSILRLAEVLIYLNYTDEIMASDKTKNIKFDIRSEASLLHIVHNLQTVGFKFHSFNDESNIFILNLYIKSNNDIQESIIHASQLFTKIAMAIDNDDFQKDRFNKLKINILDRNDFIVANAITDFQSCIDFSFSKIDMYQLIDNIKFKIDIKERLS
ncbi:hypothetical protein [Arcobacter porcinus]|uniref:Uncharacterized protein n=1 Tax=Arcobacter porcinus TaxID=1935204 RepID=A0ABX2YH30_9BACT|nr:hypothetical protein [Arcobacter porcinus]OCL90296.1 hypothetical protein AAX28_01777 [Arcobacter porcinus]